jgi:hypothetical protein
MQPPRLAPQTLLEGRERTPQRLAWLPLQPPQRWVHSHPRSSPWISYRVHNWLSTKYGYQTKCTTRENLHLQARPDYYHGWGAEDAGEVDQSSLSRRLLFLGLSSTSRDVVINDVPLLSLKTLEWSQLVFCDDFVLVTMVASHLFIGDEIGFFCHRCVSNP